MGMGQGPPTRGEISPNRLYRGLNDIAEALDTYKENVRVWISEGLPAWQESKGGTWRALGSDLIDWLKRRPKGKSLEA